MSCCSSYVVEWSPAIAYWAFFVFGVLAVIFAKKYLHETNGCKSLEKWRLSRFPRRAGPSGPRVSRVHNNTRTNQQELLSFAADSQTKPRRPGQRAQHHHLRDRPASHQHLGCMGNTYAQTPNIDSSPLMDACSPRPSPPRDLHPRAFSMLIGQLPFGTRRSPTRSGTSPIYAIPKPTGPHRRCATPDNVGMVGKYHCGTNHPPDKFGCDDDTFWGAENRSQRGIRRPAQGERLPPVKAHADIWRGCRATVTAISCAARLEQPEEATFERFIADRSIARLRQYAKEYRGDRQAVQLDVHFFGPHLPCTSLTSG